MVRREAGKFTPESGASSADPSPADRDGCMGACEQMVSFGSKVDTPADGGSLAFFVCQRRHTICYNLCELLFGDI